MRAVRSKDTVPEITLRRALWRRGYRYRLYVRGLPGRPDVVFPRAKLAVFCDGAFWHGRDMERLAQELHVNRDFWLAKIGGNVQRDRQVNKTLADLGWKVLRLWDDEIERDPERCCDLIAEALGR